MTPASDHPPAQSDVQASTDTPDIQDTAFQSEGRQLNIAAGFEVRLQRGLPAVIVISEQFATLASRLAGDAEHQQAGKDLRRVVRVHADPGEQEHRGGADHHAPGDQRPRTDARQQPGLADRADRAEREGQWKP